MEIEKVKTCGSKEETTEAKSFGEEMKDDCHKAV